MDLREEIVKSIADGSIDFDEGELEDINIEELEEMAEEYEQEIQNLQNKLTNRLQDFEQERGSKTIYLGLFQTSIYGKIVHEFHKFIRQSDKYEQLDVILESGGGQLDASVKLANICNQYSESYNVYVPFYAKSAATVIALSADKLYLGRAGELGPVDPQISHPLHGDMFLPALSIKDAVDFIEADVADEVTKEKLVDQLDTYWIGASQRAIDQSEEYLNDVAGSSDTDFARQLVQNYKDHGYPIDRTRCNELDIPIEDENSDVEQLLYEVHETAVELYERENLGYVMADSDSIQKEAEEMPISEDLPDDLEDFLGEAPEPPNFQDG